LLEGGVVLGRGAEPHVELVESGDVDRCDRAPARPRGEQHAVRGAPVAEEVDADDAVAERAKRLGERVADHRAADVVIGEVLGDVRRAVVDADRLAGAELARQQAAAQRAVDHPAERRGAVGAEVDERAGGGGAGEKFARGERGRDRARDLGGVLLAGAGDREAADREIAELGAGRGLDLEVGRCDPRVSCDHLCRGEMQRRVVCSHGAADVSTDPRNSPKGPRILGS